MILERAGVAGGVRALREWSVTAWPHFLHLRARHSIRRARNGLLGARHRCERRAVGADPTGPWDERLRAGRDPSAPTLWIVEGLLFNLAERDARTLLERLASLSAHGSLLAAT